MRYLLLIPGLLFELYLLHARPFRSLSSGDGPPNL